MQLEFKAENIMALDDGRLAIAIDHDLKQLITDIEDRPGDKSVRKLEIVLAVEPYADVDGAEITLAGAKIDWATRVKVPKRQSRQIDAQATGQGLLFNSAAPENARQTTIHDFQNQGS